MSDVMRLEFRQLGIQVAVIEPGFVGTAMGGKLQRDTEGAIGALPDEGRRRYGPVLARLAEEISQHAATRFPARGRRQSRPARLDQQEAAHSLSLGCGGETHSVHASHPPRSAIRPDHPACRRSGRLLRR
jgi:NAD(P)-dependent dehydrogenase (short-subunit alcohol dehydrogenase family)